jgi:WD40 repeat protein
VSDKTVRLWTDAGSDGKQVRGHDDWVTDANASADGQLLVTASMDGTARIWSTRSGAPVAVLRGHRDQVTRAVISPDSTQVATASSDRTVRVWSVRPPRLLLSASHWILSAVFEPHGTRIAVGEEGQSSLLDPADGGDGSVPSRHDLPILRDQGSCARDMVSDVSWSRDGKLAVGSLSCEDISGMVKQVLWDVERKREITPDWLKESMTAAFGPGTDDLLTVDRKGQIAIWDAQRLTKVAPPEGRPTVTGFGEGYSAAAMSPDGKWIAATRYNEYTVSLWRRDRPNEPRILEGHKGGVKSLQFSPDSEWLLTASSDRTACIWPVNSPGERRVLSGGHTAELSQASFDPSGKHVVTGSADSTIRVWDAGTLKELAVLRWHNEAVNDVEFSSDGKWILSASDDGTVRVGQCEACNLTVKDLRQRVRDLPKLSDDEREDVRHEIDESTRFKLPAFLSWHR